MATFHLKVSGRGSKGPQCAGTQGMREARAIGQDWREWPLTILHDYRVTTAVNEPANNPVQPYNRTIQEYAQITTRTLTITRLSTLRFQVASVANLSIVSCAGSTHNGWVAGLGRVAN